MDGGGGHTGERDPTLTDARDCWCQWYLWAPRGLTIYEGIF